MSAPQAHQTPKTTTNDVNRRSANFSPTIWGDYFLSYASIETNIEEEQRIQELKERVKRMIMAPIPSKPLKKLELIDAIQRFGVSRHFENEIDQVLLQIHNSYHRYHQGSDDDEDLHAAALYFRLLRQQGYNISCDMFNKFKDVNDAKFKGSLTNDIVGLLSLYEATHLRVHGEDILEEALSFTTTHLESAAHSLSPGPLLQQVKHALYQPFWKGNPRLEARHYLSIYRENNSHNETLLTFAKLDFNLLQKVHQKELSEISRWWKELDFVNKLPFARDRVVECYLWALGCYYEPKYSFARMIFGKVIAMLVIIDDIYDVYGTFEELELFTEAVERWDISAMVHLPEYMKVCYQALLDLYAEIEEKLGNEGNSYRIHYAREAMKIQVKSYFKEAKWFYDNYIPTMDEYLSEALNTSYFMLATTALVGMGSVVTKDSLDWVFSDPKIVKATSLIGRLVDDMKSHKFEQKRGHVASCVECYMKEHDATEEQAIIELSKQVNNAWKDVNETCHRPTIFPMQLILRIVNLARMIEVIYKHDDGFTHAGIFLKDIVVSLFVEPVPL
ncbi:(-)-germacrene D synthase-like [Pyrus ussuriensis x Pyrus communis]|uniref:(-)-germacrene D synthase-like n=1 Tax=Pyrus ussuriensis x Pyrus communis TaxID=2448454 RepID=A0A5N5GLW8_9ROSA|nr:(-)-germacrene D synthase-like [Pyrus ussuriensis x Pyrus communis]